MKYLQKSFSTGANSKEYRDNYDRIFRKPGRWSDLKKTLPPERLAKVEADVKRAAEDFDNDAREAREEELRKGATGKEQK